MRYRTVHTTSYQYQQPVAQCQNEVRLTPCSLPHQRVRETHIHVQPEPSLIEPHMDYFGNRVTYFAIFQRHERLTVTATSLVEVDAAEPEIEFPLPWEVARDQLSRAADDACLKASEFVFDSPYVAAGAELADYACPSFSSGRPLLDAVRELSHRVHTEFVYAPKSTSIDMPLPEVLRNRRGVCQDFAHIMIGALRSLGLAARYVSGYLRSGKQYPGAEASHAWMSVFIPGSGWHSFDPTNNVRPSEGHVTLAFGRDYGDVTPVKGVTLGGEDQVVDVQVSVQPVA